MRNTALLVGALGVAALVAWLVFVHDPEIAPQRYAHDASLRKLHHSWRAASLAFARQTRPDHAETASIVHQQAWEYLHVATDRTSVVCETGFFRGMSAFLWLYASRASTLHSFDVSFPKESVATLRGTFGKERLSVYEGSTRVTLPAFRPPAPCDVVSIDASHDGWDPYQDLVDLLPRVRCNATVLFDDAFDDRAAGKALDNNPDRPTFYNACTRSYWRAVREGLLAHASCENFGRRQLWWGRYPKGYCMGRAAGAPSCGKAASRRGGRIKG